MSYLYGDWNKADKFFKYILNYGNIKKLKEKALRKALAYLERQIRENITTSGNLAGKPFKPLAESTLKRKKGKNKPLIDSGDLRGNIKAYLFDDDIGFVGVKRGRIHKNSNGLQVVDIAMIHEFGVITESRVRIYARPFIRPVIEKFKNEAVKIYSNEIEEGLKQIA